MEECPYTLAFLIEQAILVGWLFQIMIRCIYLEIHRRLSGGLAIILILDLEFSVSETYLSIPLQSSFFTLR